MILVLFAYSDKQGVHRNNQLYSIYKLCHVCVSVCVCVYIYVSTKVNIHKHQTPKRVFSSNIFWGEGSLAGPTRTDTPVQYEPVYWNVYMEHTVHT